MRFSYLLDALSYSYMFYSFCCFLLYPKKGRTLKLRVVIPLHVCFYWQIIQRAVRAQRRALGQVREVVTFQLSGQFARQGDGTDHRTENQESLTKQILSASVQDFSSIDFSSVQDL